MNNGQLIPPRLSMNSDRFAGKHTEIPCGGFILFLSRGSIACSNPNLAASFRRVSAGRPDAIQQIKTTSPKNTVRAGSGLTVTDEISAAATARSAAGS